MAIDRAIAAVEQPAPEKRATVQIGMSSGRVVMINVPADFSAQEAIDLIGYIATGLPAKLAEAGATRPGILVPTPMRRT
jgi:hypothetical protein